MYHILTHAIGWGGTIAYVAAFQCKKNRGIAVWTMLGALLYIVHYFMLGALSGSISLLISMFSSFVVACAGHPWADWKDWPKAFAAAYILSTVFTWQGPLSLLPCVISIAKSWVCFLGNGKYIRLTWVCLISPGWLTYNFITGSWSGVVCELFILVSIIISLARYGLKALDQVS